MRALASSLVCALVAAFCVGGCAGASGPPEEELDFALATSSDLGTVDQAANDLAKSGDMSGVGGTSCNPANQTIGAAGGPDVCAYGEDCDDLTSTCKAVVTGSCNMVTGAPTWNKAGKMAPVITKATATLLTTTDSTTECANGDPAALLTIDFYAPMNLTTTTMAATFLPQTKFKKSVVASDPWYNGTFMRSAVPSGKFGTFKVGINCGGAGGAVKTAGFYIVDESMRASNAVCVSW